MLLNQQTSMFNIIKYIDITDFPSSICQSSSSNRGFSRYFVAAQPISGFTKWQNHNLLITWCIFLCLNTYGVSNHNNRHITHQCITTNGFEAIHQYKFYNKLHPYVFCQRIICCKLEEHPIVRHSFRSCIELICNTKNSLLSFHHHSFCFKNRAWHSVDFIMIPII